MVYTDGKHLIADTTEELHRFAQKINLKRSWYHGNKLIPHYIVKGKQIKEAIQKGAKKINVQKLFQKSTNKDKK
jgi:hypothetical protein